MLTKYYWHPGFSDLPTALYYTLSTYEIARDMGPKQSPMAEKIQLRVVFIHSFLKILTVYHPNFFLNKFKQWFYKKQ